MYRLSFIFTRGKSISYLSHLDMMRLMIRAMRRAHLPLAYSQGFNPHPRFTLALPLPLGVTADCEPGEAYFCEPLDPALFVEKLNKQLPSSLVIRKASVAPLEAPALASLVEAAAYSAVLRCSFSGDEEAGAAVGINVLEKALNNLLAKEEILYPRLNKKKKTTYTNVRPYILEAKLAKEAGGPAVLHLNLKAGSRGGVAPAFLLDQLAIISGCKSLKALCWDLHRNNLFRIDGNVLQPLSEGM